MPIFCGSYTMRPGDDVTFVRLGRRVVGRVVQVRRLGSRGSVVVQTPLGKIAFFGRAAAGMQQLT